jgi:ATP-dependent Clp protease ATP-binding subunit ClpA
VFERFTDAARRVVVAAQEEARDNDADHIRPEHLLLALVRVDGVAADLLAASGVTAEALRPRLERGSAVSPSHIPFSPVAKEALEAALREAKRRRSDQIDTEHLLFGILSTADETVVELLLAVGADPVALRQTLMGHRHRRVQRWSDAAHAEDALVYVDEPRAVRRESRVMRHSVPFNVLWPLRRPQRRPRDDPPTA